MKFIPREKQKKVLEYTKGTMCVSAVPGAGKTITLSALAADLIEKNIGEQPVDSYENPGHEILVVTFSNAAQISFASKIAGFLNDRGIKKCANNIQQQHFHVQRASSTIFFKSSSYGA